MPKAQHHSKHHQRSEDIGDPDQERGADKKDVRRLHLNENALNRMAHFRTEWIEKPLDRIGTDKRRRQAQAAHDRQAPARAAVQRGIDFQPLIEPFPGNRPQQQPLSGNNARVQIGPEAHDQRQPAGKRPASVAMIVQPAGNQKESNSRAIERAQVPARTEHANGCQESQGNPVPANAFLSQSYRQQEQRSGNRNRLEKLQAPEAERGPDGPKDHLVESFEFGHGAGGRPGRLRQAAANPS